MITARTIGLIKVFSNMETSTKVHHFADILKVSINACTSIRDVIHKDVCERYQDMICSENRPIVDTYRLKVCFLFGWKGLPGRDYFLFLPFTTPPPPPLPFPPH
jgi:hypothetical protein